MGENWKGVPERVLLVVPITGEGLANGCVHTEVEEAIVDVERFMRSADVTKCRVDVIYRDGFHSHCFAVEGEAWPDAGEVLRRRVARCDQARDFLFLTGL